MNLTRSILILFTIISSIYDSLNTNQHYFIALLVRKLICCPNRIEHNNVISREHGTHLLCVDIQKCFYQNFTIHFHGCHFLMATSSVFLVCLLFTASLPFPCDCPSISKFSKQSPFYLCIWFIRLPLRRVIYERTILFGGIFNGICEPKKNHHP